VNLIAKVALDGAAARLAAPVVALAWRVEGAGEMALAFGGLAWRFPPIGSQRRRPLVVSSTGRFQHGLGRAETLRLMPGPGLDSHAIGDRFSMFVGHD
jgi:hypothetical protein